MKRTPLRRDTPKSRAWAELRTPLKRKKRMRLVNRERRARIDEIAEGWDLSWQRECTA